MESLGKKIKQLRDRKNLTQQEVADLLDVKATTVSNWENEVSNPKLEMLQKLSNILGVDVTELISKNEAPKECYDPEMAKNYERTIQVQEKLIKYLEKRVEELESEKSGDLNKSVV